MIEARARYRAAARRLRNTALDRAIVSHLAQHQHSAYSDTLLGTDQVHRR